MAHNDFDRQEGDRQPSASPPVHVHVHVNNSNDNSARTLTVSPSFGDGGSEIAGSLFPLVLVAIILASMGISNANRQGKAGNWFPDCSAEFRKLEQPKLR